MSSSFSGAESPKSACISCALTLKPNGTSFVTESTINCTFFGSTYLMRSFGYFCCTPKLKSTYGITRSRFKVCSSCRTSAFRMSCLTACWSWLSPSLLGVHRGLHRRCLNPYTFFAVRTSLAKPNSLECFCIAAFCYCCAFLTPFITSFPSGKLARAVIQLCLLNVVLCRPSFPSRTG